MRGPIPKKPKHKALDLDAAEAIGLQGLGFLAADDDRIAKFLGLTGILPNDLIARAKTPEMLLAVLEYLAQDELLLLEFAAEAEIQPEIAGEAIRLLVRTDQADFSD